MLRIIVAPKVSPWNPGGFGDGTEYDIKWNHFSVTDRQCNRDTRMWNMKISRLKTIHYVYFLCRDPQWWRGICADLPDWRQPESRRHWRLPQKWQTKPSSQRSPLQSSFWISSPPLTRLTSVSDQHRTAKRQHQMWTNRLFCIWRYSITL